MEDGSARSASTVQTWNRYSSVYALLWIWLQENWGILQLMSFGPGNRFYYFPLYMFLEWGKSTEDPDVLPTDLAGTWPRGRVTKPSAERPVDGLTRLSKRLSGAVQFTKLSSSVCVRRLLRRSLRRRSVSRTSSCGSVAVVEWCRRSSFGPNNTSVFTW